MARLEQSRGQTPNRVECMIDREERAILAPVDYLHRPGLGSIPKPAAWILVASCHNPIGRMDGCHPCVRTIAQSLISRISTYSRARIASSAPQSCPMASHLLSRLNPAQCLLLSYSHEHAAGRVAYFHSRPMHSPYTMQLVRAFYRLGSCTISALRML